MKRNLTIAGLWAAACLAVAPAYGQSSAPSKLVAAPAKPAPRLPDGKVDFGGKGVWAPIWVLDWSDQKYVEHAVDVPFTTKGLQLFQQRRANESKDDPEG